MRFRFGVCAGVLGAALLTGSAANASVITSGPFPGAGNPYFSATDGAGTIPAGGQTAFMWTTGDYVETVHAKVTGSYLATSLTDTFTVQNYLGSGNNLTIDGLLNGIDVGSFTVLDSGYSGSDQTITFDPSFAPVLLSGPFTFEYVLENTIPTDGGSIAFLDGGQASISGTRIFDSVPEPFTLSLFGAGLAGAAALRRRKKKVQA
jgi:PEP-CTERM motif